MSVAPIYVSLSTATKRTCSVALPALPALVPVTSGCGSWQCRTPAGAFTACSDDFLVCPAGCNETEVESAIPAATLACVSAATGAEIDAATLCPANFVTKPANAGTCKPSSTCGYKCLSYPNSVVMQSSGAAASFAPIECTDSSSWNPVCSQNTCGFGTSNRTTYCVDTTLALIKSTDVYASKCGGVANPPTTVRDCASYHCDQYLWQCALAPDDGSLDDGAVTWLSCYESAVDLAQLTCTDACGSALKTRAARCVMRAVSNTVNYTFAGFTQSHGRAAALLQPCAAYAPVPELVHTCTSEAGCAAATWMCHATGAAASTAVPCSDNDGLGGFAEQCPTTGCIERPVSPTRVARCMFAGHQVPTAQCGGTAPALSANCTTVKTSCGIFARIDSKCKKDGETYTCQPDPENEIEGIVTEAVCMDHGKNIVSSTLCGAAANTTLTFPCYLPACNTTVTYKWEVDDFATCPSSVKGCRKSSYKVRRC